MALAGMPPNVGTSNANMLTQQTHDDGDVDMTDAPEVVVAEDVEMGQDAPKPEALPLALPQPSLPSTLPPPQSAQLQQQQQQPPEPSQTLARRKKPTPAEIKEKEDEKAAKAKAAEEKREEKARLAEEKAKFAEERRLVRLEEQRKKDERKAEEQRKKDEKQRKENEIQRKKDEELKKQQSKMANFFGAPKKKAVTEVAVISTTTTAAAAAAATTTDGSQDIVMGEDDVKVVVVAVEKTEYEKRFQPFFVKPETTLAVSPFRSVSKKDAVQRLALFEENIQEQQQQQQQQQQHVPKKSTFSSFHRNGHRRSRGIVHPAVRDVVNTLRTSHDEFVVRAERAKLAEIPRKTISFHQDVRPPYVGTLTAHAQRVGRSGMARLGRNPFLRDILPLQYDYDSEAEWDDDDGEDVDDGEEDDDELDDEDDLEGFLDDEGDEASGALRGVQGDMEPVSTGVVFEGATERRKEFVDGFRMEFMLGEFWSVSTLSVFLCV